MDQHTPSPTHRDWAHSYHTQREGASVMPCAARYRSSSRRHLSHAPHPTKRLLHLSGRGPMGWVVSVRERSSWIVPRLRRCLQLRCGWSLMPCSAQSPRSLGVTPAQAVNGSGRATSPASSSAPKRDDLPPPGGNASTITTVRGGLSPPIGGVSACSGAGAAPSSSTGDAEARLGGGNSAAMAATALRHSLTVGSHHTRPCRCGTRWGR